VQLSGANGQFDPRGCTVALSQHDLLRLLESLRSADGLELVREIAERLLQELIEAEATARRP
jgi:putative transposase